MAAVWVHNLAAHWLQAALVVFSAAVIAAALPLNHPRMRLVFWRALFALTLMLPLLQRWEPAASATKTAGAPMPAPLRTIQLAGADAGALSWPELILAIAAVGIALRLAWIALGLARLHSLRRLPRVPAPCAAEFEAAMREVGVDASLRLGTREGPFNFGMLRPVVVVPDSYAALDVQARRAVILHELIHIRRHDWMAALIEELSLAVVWFHPWCWWIRAQIRLAREQTVDREVVARVGSREAYATCLLSVAGYDLGGFRSSVALLRRRELRQRLDALFQEAVMSPVRLALTIGVLGSILTGAAAAAASAFPFMSVAAIDVEEQGNSRRVLHLIPPEYPSDAEQAGVVGAVTVEVTISAAGDVTAFNVIDGPEALRTPTIAAVRQWRFATARHVDVLIVEVGYELTYRDDRRIPAWSFIVRDKSAAASNTPTVPSAAEPDVKAPKMIKEVRAVYPADAKAARVQGVVQVEATIGADGKPRDVRVIRSIPMLDEAAVESIRQSEFEPGMRRGVAVPVVVQIAVQFTLK